MSSSQKPGDSSRIVWTVQPVSSRLNDPVLFLPFFPFRTLSLEPRRKCSHFLAPTMVSGDRRETGSFLPSAAQKMRKARFLSHWSRYRRKFPISLGGNLAEKDLGEKGETTSVRILSCSFISLCFVSRSNLTRRKKPKFSTASLAKELTHPLSVFLLLKEKQDG